MVKPLMTQNRTYTRKLDKILSDLDDKFKSICDTSAFARKLSQLINAPVSARPSVLSELYEMLDRCNIAYERNMNNKYYEHLINISDIPDAKKIEVLVIAEICSMCHEFPSPEEYMLRIVNALSSSSDGWDNDTLRLRILKQFIKYGNYLSDANFGGRAAIKKYAAAKSSRQDKDNNILANIDDDIFSCLDNASKDDRKPEGRYGLIKLADDLAFGKFRTGGATKRALYLFAMVYGMTYTIHNNSHDTAILDIESDIEKNLFTDYYCNNLMRCISAAYKTGASQFEADPSGQGINYKNFVEMIYLYFISSDYTPQEKISRSSKMINDVQNADFIINHAVLNHDTMHYKQIFTEDILNLSEDDFREFILRNYNCNTGGKVGGIQLETEQNTAFNEYQAVVKKLNACLCESCDYGLWFTALWFNNIDDLKNKVCSMKNIDSAKFDDCIALLASVNNFLTSGKAFNIKNPSQITRTVILTVYYYYFNALHENDSKGIWDSFETLYNTFKAGVDPVLQRAGYQLLNGRNIFDLLITFSSYSYMNF